VRLDLAKSVGDARRDAGISACRLAGAAGVGLATVQQLEAAARDPGLEVLARIAAALGGKLKLWIEPGTGVAVHDRYQSAMLGALIRALDPSWNVTLEVAVTDPVDGVIDAVLDRHGGHEAVAVESESGLYRIEQQIRWAGAKADALAFARTAAGFRPEVSRLLLLRSTAATRAVAATYPDVLAVAYPGRVAEALAALTGEARWFGPTLLWCAADRSGARLLDEPPRGVTLGQ